MSIVRRAVVEGDKPMLTPEQVVGQLRALQQQIPEFMQLPNEEAREIRRSASVSAEFTSEAISVVGASDIVQTVIGNTPDELHQAEDEIARWSVVANELRTMLRGVSAANLVRRHRLGKAALQTYRVSSQLVRQEEHSHLLPHVESMSRMRKFDRRRRSRTVVQPVPPEPQQNKPA